MCSPSLDQPRSCPHWHTRRTRTDSTSEGLPEVKNELINKQTKSYAHVISKALLSVRQTIRLRRRDVCYIQWKSTDTNMYVTLFFWNLVYLWNKVNQKKKKNRRTTTTRTHEKGGKKKRTSYHSWGWTNTNKRQPPPPTSPPPKKKMKKWNLFFPSKTSIRKTLRY